MVKVMEVNCIYRDLYEIDLTRFNKFHEPVKVELCLTKNGDLYYRLSNGEWIKLCSIISRIDGGYCHKCGHPLYEGSCYAHEDYREILTRTIPIGLYF